MAKRMVDGIMRPHKRQNGKSAVEIIEEAVHLLRMSPIETLVRYYIGTLPFMLFLFYFWADMSSRPCTADRCIVSSLMLALLFVWMKTWQTLFAQKMRADLRSEPPPAFSFRRVVRMAATQCLSHATGLYILPLSLVLGVPFGWSYAFYQNLSVLDGGERDLRFLFGQSWHHMKLQPGQNHVILLILSAFGLFVFLNIALTILLLPHMLNSLLGIETIFSLGGWRAALNTTFLVISAGMTYLCVDPLLKTVYLLRCFYASSLTSGDDLKTDLKQLIPYGRFILILIFVLGFEAFSPLLAAERSMSVIRDSRKPVSAGELNHAIEEVMNREEFAWRMPRERIEVERATKTAPMSWLTEWTGEVLKKIYRTIGRWLERFSAWVNDLFPKQDPEKRSSPEGNWIDSHRNFLWALLAGLIFILATFLLMTLRHRKKGLVASAAAGTSTAQDMLNEQIKADGLPPGRWLMLARELMEQGSLGLALRAFYLATLAHMADQGLITIAGYKSNRDYEQELRRRAYEQRELISIFSKNVKVFEMTWYGKHEVTRDILSRFLQNHERMVVIVQK